MIIGLRISHRILEATVLQKFLDEWAKASLIGIHGVANIHPRFVLATLLPTRDMVPESRCMPPLKPGLMKSEDLVTAVIRKALNRMAESKHAKLRPSLVVHMLNTHLHISHNCCGNLHRPFTVRFFQDKNNKNMNFQD
ncbi:hypothetical protein WN944_016128 [Citrus x changshan-huyou]|uniref:Uncharacterized protein n=1 Tax=Citrus x changshan-huyou TaxID=2935761 RepID=A0AAP0QK46_9ROSI